MFQNKCIVCIGYNPSNGFTGSNLSDHFTSNYKKNDIMCKYRKYCITGSNLSDGCMGNSQKYD